MGWQIDGELLNPTLLSLDPIPQVCHDVTIAPVALVLEPFAAHAKKARMSCTRACACKEVIDSQCANC